jgi:arylamine N-acetyltransferase
MLVEKFLSFLGEEREKPNLQFLNQLVASHQRKVKWENLTKIVDWEKGHQTGNYLPPIETYINRIVEKGLGGTCWSIAAGFHWLLTKLGFEVHYLYMDPGHLCLRVDLEKPYYVDLGYCAPLFRAYPMDQSFTVKDNREEFQFIVEGGTITTIRTPGPTKTLRQEPVTLTDMNPLIEQSNQWATSQVLKEMRIFAYVDGIPTSLNNNVLKQYFTNEVSEKVLTHEDVVFYITKHFGVDLDFYEKTRRIYDTKMELALKGQ